MLRDQHRLRSRLRHLEELSRRDQPLDPVAFDRSVRQLTEWVEQSAAVRAERLANLPKPTFPEELPVVQRREEIAEAIAANQVVVLCGETGSGKTTQLPKICLELGRGVAGMIGHTQPRRIAARSVATRIAEELQTPLGHAVGYKVRFSDHTRPETYVKLMTDGILLAETQGDRFLDAYDTIIIDEAHERSLNIDFLLGYLKQLLPQRPDLKLIITSATIDPQRFSKHFGDCADDRGLGPDVPGRGALPAAAERGPGRGRRRDAPGHPRRGGRAVARRGRATCWSSCPASGRSARRPRRCASTTRRGWRSCRCTRGSAPTEQMRRLPAARQAADRAGDQRGRDVADGAGHPVRDRPRLRPAQPVQPADEGAAAADRADQPGQRRPAQGPLRPGRARASASGSIREEDFDGPAAVHRPGDPAHEPGQRHPADEGVPARGGAGLPVRRAAGLPR